MLEKQVARMKEGEVPDRVKGLHQVHSSLLDTALKGVDLLLEAAEEDGPAFLDSGVVLPFGIAFEQERLVEKIAELEMFSIGGRDRQREQTYLESLKGVVKRAGEADADFMKASTMWRDAATRTERAKAMEMMAAALAALAGPVETELKALKLLRPPPRYRDFHMAYEDALRFEAIACRKAPPAMRRWDNKGIGRWTSLLNLALNLKRRAPDLLEKLSGE